MPRTNEEIDKINKSREFAGLEKLPYETEGAATAAPAADAEETPEQKAERERVEKEAAQEAQKQADLIVQEAQKLAQEKLEADKIEQQKLQKEKEEQEKQAEIERKLRGEFNDEELRAILKNRGIEVEDISQLKPVKSEADLQKEKEKREADKIAFGLSKGLFTKKEYDSYSADVNDVEQVVFEDFSADQLAADPSLTPLEIKEMFEERFGLNAPEKSLKRDRGEKELGIIGRQIINSKHAKILSLDSQFDVFETSEKQRTAENNKIIAAAPVYKKDVEEVFNEIKTVKVDFGNGIEYSAEISDDVIDALKSQHLKTEFVAEQIKSGWDRGQMKAAVELAALKKDLNNIVMKIADQHVIAKAAGTHGIILPGQQEIKTEETKVLAPEVQDELDRRLGRGKYADQNV